MSELSTVAIKDGHRGHLPHHHNPMDAERADRISRLTGLGGLATARQPSGLGSTSGLSGGGGSAGGHSSSQQQLYAQQQGGVGGGGVGYFDANNQPQMTRERSTVGSASATGSVDDPDKMSEDTMDTMDQETAETSSTGGFSDEAASLVGFGEGARTPARQQSGAAAGAPGAAGLGVAPGSPVMVSKGSAVPSYLRETQTPVSGGSAVSGGGATPSSTDARMIDGMTYDAGVVDTVTRTPPPTTTMAAGSAEGGVGRPRSPTGTETAERIMRERIEREEAAAEGRAMRSPDLGADGEKGLGKFYFEGKQ